MHERRRQGHWGATQRTVKFFEALLRASVDGVVAAVGSGLLSVMVVMSLPSIVWCGRLQHAITGILRLSGVPLIGP